MCDSRRCVSSILLKWVVLLEAIFLVNCDELTTTDDYLAPGSPLDGCSGKPADVIFVLDSSNSIWSRDFRSQMEFVSDVILLFPIDSGHIRVGLMTFADFPTLHFRLGQYDRKSDVQSAIARIRHVGGYGTRTAEALRFLREVGFEFPVSENRNNVTRVGIVVTDGLSDDPKQTRREAERTRERGIHLFAVGVGSNRDLEELAAIASSPKQDYTILADSYRGLNSIRKLLAIKTCAVTNPTTTTTSTTTATTTATTTSTTTTTTTVPTTTKVLAMHKTTEDGTTGRSSDDRTVELTEDGRSSNLPSYRIPNTVERIGGEWFRVNSREETSGPDGVEEEGGRSKNDLEKTSLLLKRPVYWKLDTNGKSSRIRPAEYKLGDEKVSPSVTNGSTVTIEGDKIWSSELDSNRSLVGVVINGSKFIGHWIDADRRIWFGYAVMDTAGRGNGINASQNSVETVSEVGNNRQEREEDTAFPDEDENPDGDGTEGFWAMDEAGRSVWYRYVRPGVYESATEFEMSSEHFGKTTVGVGDAANGNNGGGSASQKNGDVSKMNQVQKGCRPLKPTDVAFVLDHTSGYPEVVQDSWILARAIISELDTEEEDFMSFRFVHRCSGSACLDHGRYSSKADALRAVDANLQAIRKNSSHLIDTMRDFLKDNEIRPRRRVGVYMTNSRSDNFDETVMASDRAKHTDHIEMFAVGLGQAANPTELQAVASCPVEQHYYLLQRRFNDQTAEAVARKISRLVCLGRNKA